MDKNSSNVGTKYDRIAPVYDFWDIIPERLFYRAWRHQLWSRLAAERILEIGVGTGKNIPFYPSGAEVTAVDISPRMLEKAAKRAMVRQDISIELVVMDLNALSFQDDIFDAVVGSFIFTVMPNPLGALQEIKRICRPGGALSLLEFTRGENRLALLLQGLMAPLTYAVYGAYINRDIMTPVSQSGFKIISAQDMANGTVKLIHAVSPQKNSLLID
jgi:ubiquinone/menaquinone biosynthesis C-methylase UbiE